MPRGCSTRSWSGHTLVPEKNLSPPSAITVAAHTWALRVPPRSRTAATIPWQTTVARRENVSPPPASHPRDWPPHRWSTRPRSVAPFPPWHLSFAAAASYCATAAGPRSCACKYATGRCSIPDSRCAGTRSGARTTCWLGLVSKGWDKRSKCSCHWSNWAQFLGVQNTIVQYCMSKMFPPYMHCR